jgi:phosphoribosylformylglycinamidine synthase
VLLFGETQSRILVTISDKNLKTVLTLAEKHKVAAAVLGKTGGDTFKISVNDLSIFEIPVSEAFKAWKQAIPDYFTVT